MILEWKKALGYTFQSEGWKWNFGIAGLVLFLLPPLGWYLAMGYRKQVAFRLVDGQVPVLPDYVQSWRESLWSGFKAVGVIFVYMIPFFLLYWILGVKSLETFMTNGFLVVGFFICIILLPPICIPGLPIVYAWQFEWVELIPFEWGVLSLLFLGTVFCLPSAFLRVTLKKRFSAAFDVREVLNFIVKNIWAYVEAWILSIAVTLISILSLPLFFWTVIWSYMVIIHAFNQVLRQSDMPGVKERFSESSI